jgi:tRNA(Ile)-lysidine synthase
MLQSFQHTIDIKNLFHQKDKLLVAVSGGIDSVVLCELCQQAGYSFLIAHCNFQLRGEESERDEKFVRSLGDKYNVELLVQRFDTALYASSNKVSVQVAARELRYQWFEQLIKKDNKANYLLTAEHADDNLETEMMNFFRGTGLHGLTGIPEATDYIRRPLLVFSKEEIRAFASQHQLNYVEDSSNQSSKYTRNLFRNEIIPMIEKAYPEVKTNLQDNIERFKEIEKLYKLATGKLIDRICRTKGNEIHIPIKQLLAFNNKAIIYEIISKSGFSEKQVDEVIKLADSESGRYIQSPTSSYRIIKHRHWFIISSVQDAEAGVIVIDDKDIVAHFSNGNLEIRTIPIGKFNLKADASFACLDKSGIQFPLLLRKWKQGDYFYPLGMKKKKKLSRFLIDQKLSKTAKEKQWVIEMNKKIIWVVGMRIDERFKVKDRTREVLEIFLRPSQ